MTQMKNVVFEFYLASPALFFLNGLGVAILCSFLTGFV